MELTLPKGATVSVPESIILGLHYQRMTIDGKSAGGANRVQNRCGSRSIEGLNAT